jgi:hypothetical protein
MTLVAMFRKNEIFSTEVGSKRLLLGTVPLG